MIKLQLETPKATEVVADNPVAVVGYIKPRTEPWIVALVAFGFGVLFGLMLSNTTLFKDNEQGNDQEQVQPDDEKQSAKYDKAWVVIIEESSERKPEVARILAHKDYLDSLAARNLKWRVYDKDSKSAASYLEAANRVGLPAILVLTEAGKLIDAKACPPTAATLDEFIKKATGL